MAYTGHNTPQHIRVPGRVIAWLALVVALGASVGANVAQARPEIGPRLTAAGAPVIVIIASWLLERVDVTGARWWKQLVLVGGLFFVIGGAFVTSFQHQFTLLRRYGNETLSAILLPLSIDVLILMASVALTIIAERRRELADTAEEIAAAAEDDPAMSGSDPDVSTDIKQPKRTRRPQTTEERIAAARKREPDLSAAALARKLGLSDKTVREYLKKLGQADEPQPINGAEVPDLVAVGADA